jgi:hypothetical protein
MYFLLILKEMEYVRYFMLLHGYVENFLSKSIFLIIFRFVSCIKLIIIPPRNEVVGGYTGFTMSVRLLTNPM